jgi:membrane protein required for colicin V production
MWIDVLFLLCLIMAVYRGLRHGLIISIVSAAAYIIGLAAAIKLSAAVATWLGGSTHLSSRWLPVLAFLLVFVGVVLIVRWAGRLAEKMIDLAMMGWLNKLAGILLYSLLYTTILSIVLFYGREVGVVADNTITTSVVYPVIKSWGPAVIEEFGKFVPFFKGMFKQLEDFFGRLNDGRWSFFDLNRLF